jgi:hypothetical protein
MLFKEIIAVYSKNHAKHKIHADGKVQSLLNIETGGRYSSHRGLKG